MHFYKPIKRTESEIFCYMNCSESKKWFILRYVHNNSLVDCTKVGNSA